jgi:hypothetical protein
MKVCNKCGKEKPLDEFNKDKTKSSGLHSRCKLCDKQATVEWQKNNNDRYRANVDKWYNNNQDKHYASVRKNHSKIPPGVYQIKCMVNGKRYIGKSINPYLRKTNHFSIGEKQPNNTNEFLQADLKQYGKKSFVFGIIEHCPIDLLLERETYYINTYKPEYNAQVEAFKTTN